MTEHVILVDENDKEIGTEEKLRTHQLGRLHRAFSIFVFDSNGRMMLQQRAKSKYHCGGLWTNTCCSHPRPGEPLEQAAHRRLKEEMGFDCELKKEFTYVYKVKFDNGLTEHEFLHVFSGRFDSNPVINKDEADDWKWIGMKEIIADIEKNPQVYTHWFRLSLKRFI